MLAAFLQLPNDCNHSLSVAHCAVSVFRQLLNMCSFLTAKPVKVSVEAVVRLSFSALSKSDPVSDVHYGILFLC